ncbi:MAG: protein of unknown function acetylesterase [Eubacterium sp.]|nr:protein of unknown function acetylesterase [Eubacterium sp.]
MELPMERVKDQYPEEMINCLYPEIRHFNVTLKYDFNSPGEDLDEGFWESANPETIKRFSAVGYFFAKTLYEKYHIPVGFIKAAIGGSPIESWISEEALGPYQHIMEALIPFKDSEYVKKVLLCDGQIANEWYRRLDENDQGISGSGWTWYSDEVDTSKWSDIYLPDKFANVNLKNFNGVIWFRKEIDVSEDMLNRPAKLWLGRIVDSDKTYVNGQFVGEVTYQYPPRKYDIPPELLRKGRNTITVRVICKNGIGEFVADKPYKLFTENFSVELTGQWKYKVGAVCSPLPDTPFVYWQPTGLYNGLLAPLTRYTVKGALWYQGEANTSCPSEYHSLMKTLVADWRKKWNQSRFPFLYVQLPNYGAPDKQPSESQWAELREAQLDSMTIPDTAMVVSIDLGEWNDLHPLKKRDVGCRLAVAAQKLAYHEDITASGPIYEGIKFVENKAVISFDNTGSGLKSRDGLELKHFAIAGGNGEYRWAEAKIEGDTVVVWNNSISEPKAVRYAWADNPEAANLINVGGLPASPFRTDR